MKQRRIQSILGRSLVGLMTLGVALLLAGMIQLIIERAQAQPLQPQNPKSQTNIITIGAATPKFREPTPEPQTGDNSPANMSTEEMFQEIAGQYDLDWRLLAELAYQESHMNPWAIGQDNDMGLMQIIPTTWDEFAPQVGVTDPFDPYSNIQVGAAYLAYIRNFTHSRGYAEDVWMLVGYNWGPDNLDKLFSGHGTWAQVPARQRNYALAIVEAAYNRTSRWQVQ